MQIRSVGIDLGKTTFHLVALGASGKVLMKKKFTQKHLLAFTANMQIRETIPFYEWSSTTVRLFRTETQQNSSWPGAHDSTKGRIHCRRLVFSTKLALAVTRRTMHCQNQSAEAVSAGENRPMHSTRIIY